MLNKVIYKQIFYGIVLCIFSLIIGCLGLASRVSKLDILPNSYFKIIVYILLISLIIFITLSIISFRLAKKEGIKLKEKEELYYGHFGIMTFILIVLFNTKDLYITILTVIAELFFVCVHVMFKISEGLYEYEKSNRKYLSLEELRLSRYSFLWQFKIWSNTKENVNKKLKKPNSFALSVSIGSIIYIVLGVLGLFKIIELNIIFIFLLLILRKNYLCCLDSMFNLYTSTSGKCTSIEHFKGKNEEHWIICVTDFMNKKELKFQTFEKPRFREGNDIVTIHGVLSKRVVKANGYEIDCKLW